MIDSANHNTFNCSGRGRRSAILYYFRHMEYLEG